MDVPMICVDSAALVSSAVTIGGCILGGFKLLVKYMSTKDAKCLEEVKKISDEYTKDLEEERKDRRAAQAAVLEVVPTLALIKEHLADLKEKK